MGQEHWASKMLGRKVYRKRPAVDVRDAALHWLDLKRYQFELLSGAYMLDAWERMVFCTRPWL